MLSLLCLFLIPLLASFVAMFMPKIPPKLFKWLSVLAASAPLALLIYGNTRWLGVQIDYMWLPQLGIRFHLAVDPLSLLFLFLTALIVPLSLLAARSDALPKPNAFYGLILLLQALLIGFFTAKDLAVFALFWESMLIPLYFIIAFWGGAKREAAALKFIVYMVAGSALMIAAILALYFAAASFDIEALSSVAGNLPYAPWLCAVFLLAFAVKTPLFPFHAWLPDAYYEAPTSGTILLSAILSKAGIYGIVRIGLQFFPEQIMAWSHYLAGLAIVGVFYGGFGAWMQDNYKRLIAYSSLSHVNFILVGLLIWNQAAHGGAILQALNHGVTIAGLFLLAGWLEERIGSYKIDPFGGLAKYLPHLCWLTLFFVLSSVALPGLNNFIGELLILFGLFQQAPWPAAILSLSVILSVIYMLRWMQKVYFGQPAGYQTQDLDIGGKEFLIALPLILAILWVGIYPEPILKQIQPITEKIASAATQQENK